MVRFTTVLLDPRRSVCMTPTPKRTILHCECDFTWFSCTRYKDPNRLPTISTAVIFPLLSQAHFLPFSSIKRRPQLCICWPLINRPSAPSFKGSASKHVRSGLHCNATKFTVSLPQDKISDYCWCLLCWPVYSWLTVRPIICLTVGEIKATVRVLLHLQYRLWFA